MMMNSTKSFHQCSFACVFALILALVAPSAADARSHHRKKSKRTKTARVVRKSVPIAPFSTVVIDAGHGGGDPGGTSQNIIPEKNVALDVAKRLQTNLRRAGLNTVMTRSDDRFIPLDQRVAIANSYRNAIFMCIHFNSAGRRSARGVETFFAAPTEARLAVRIQQNLAATTTGPSRGVKRAGFRVLRNTRMRAVLAECGFLTNPQEPQWRTTPATVRLSPGRSRVRLSTSIIHSARCSRAHLFRTADNSCGDRRRPVGGFKQASSEAERRESSHAANVSESPPFWTRWRATHAALDDAEQLCLTLNPRLEILAVILHLADAPERHQSAIRR